jgi:hypothetical protein
MKLQLIISVDRLVKPCYNTHMTQALVNLAIMLSPLALMLVAIVIKGEF